ncbi:unnamed protein product [Alopecurus aequalis]
MIVLCPVNCHSAARSQPPSMATAGERNGGEPPGLGKRRRPRFRPADASSDMAGGGGVGGKEDSGREPQLVHILALPAAAPPAVVVSRLDSAVPRKARTCLPRAVPSAWWSGRISFHPPPPAEEPAKEEEGRRFPRPQRVRVAPTLDLDTAAVGGEKPAKRLRRCLHCGRKEMRRGTLCNACGVWYSKTGALPERRPAASPIVDAPPENPIWEPEVPGAIYLVRKSAAERRPHRTEAAPAPRPATRCLNCGSSELPLWIEGPTGRREVCAACGMRYKKGRLLPECPPAVRSVTDSPPQSPITKSLPESPIWEPEASPPSMHLPKKISKKISKKKNKKNKGPAPWPTDMGKTCLHCGTSKTPQWREGPKGKGTLCNACGVRYRQGGLLPEYRPVASPTFLPSKHANLRRKVLQMHRNQQDPSPPAPVDNFTNLPPICGDRPTNTAVRADENPANAPGCIDKSIDLPSSLDSLLLDGPSAPLIVESDEFMIS